MNVILAVVGVPAYAIGWVTGFVLRPFWIGYNDGILYLPQAEGSKRIAAAQAQLGTQEDE